MNLFNNRKQQTQQAKIYSLGEETPADWIDQPEKEDIDKREYNQVLNYLIALDDESYEKLGKVVGIYRKAEKQVAEVMGVDEQADAPAEQTPESEDAELDAFLETTANESTSTDRRK